MTKQITISSLTGSQPYHVYLCDDTFTTCASIDTINDSEIPFSFIVGSPYLSMSTVGIEVKDKNKCVIRNLVNL